LNKEEKARKIAERMKEKEDDERKEGKKVMIMNVKRKLLRDASGRKGLEDSILTV
jgi:hypothetical protein